MDTFFETLTNFAIIFSVINALLYMRSFVRNNKAFKIYALYLLLVSIIQIASFIVAKVFENNIFLSHFYFIIQFVLLSFFYRELLKFKWIPIVLIFVLFILTYQYFEEPSIFFQYNAIGMIITHAILVLYALLYFYKSLSGKGEFLIVNVGVFFYLLSSTLIFASGNLVFNLNVSKSVVDILIQVNVDLYLVFQILIFIEWYRNYRKKPSLK